MGRDVEGMILAIEGYLEEGREKEAKQSAVSAALKLLMPNLLADFKVVED